MIENSFFARIGSRQIQFVSSITQAGATRFPTRATRRTHGVSTVVVLALVLGVVLLGLTFYAMRSPTVTTAEVETESIPDSGRTALKRLRSSAPELNAEMSKGSSETAVEVGNQPSSEGVSGKKRSRRNRLAEGESPPARSPEVEERLKLRREERREKTEAKRSARMGPSTAAEAIERLKAEGGIDPQWLGQGWMPPEDSVLSELSPDLLESLGFEATGDGVMPTKDIDLDYRLVVMDYTYSSAAKRAGIEPGDEIVSYFGEPVRNVTELKALKDLAESFESKKVAVQIRRTDGIHEFEIRPGKLGVILNGE